MANKKQSSKKMAELASEVLKSDNFSDKAKSLAGSVLSQTKSNKNSKKKK